MCGIAGIWAYRKEVDLSEIVTQMVKALSHRGPDHEGMFRDPQHPVALGHRRLSILDLSSTANQPMGNDSGTLVIVYNGEIYNFEEIRNELIAKGHRFKTNSDTEVVLKGYEHWGVAALQKFIGMFAFAIWDRTREKLILCRDRVGVKPLYFYAHDGLFLFGSELKAFHQVSCITKTLDTDVLPLYLQFGYIPGPYSILRHIHKLLPGHYLEVDAQGTITQKQYWDASVFFRDGAEQDRNGLFDHRSDESVAEELESLLVSAFKYRLVADVPVGIFLSGGLDSTLVTALLRKYTSYPIQTFTIGFPVCGFDEAPFARQVAAYLGTEHHEVYCSPQDVLENLDRVIELFDEPFADNSALPTFLLSRMARQRVKVALSADGGDELFWGYTHYSATVKFHQCLNVFPRFARSLLFSALKKPGSDTFIAYAYKVLASVLPFTLNPATAALKLRECLQSDDMGQVFEIARSIWFPCQIPRLLLSVRPLKNGLVRDQFGAADLQAIPPALRLSLIDLQTYLVDDILTKVDRCTMGVGLEGREPLLDHHLLEYVAKLPLRFKFRNGVSKWMLRKILYKYVPRHLVERPKQGFSMPLHAWFRTHLGELYKEYLNKDRLNRGGLFNGDIVEQVLTQYLRGKPVHYSSLWTLFVFQKWREVYRV